MNKFKTTDTGGLDLKLNDFRFISRGIDDAFKGILSAFTPTATTYILSGCTYTLVSGTMTMSEGYVAIDGEVCYVPAHSISFTTSANLYWDVEISYDSEGFKQFENFDWHDTYEVRVAKIKYNNTAVPLGKTSLLSTKNITTLLKESVGMFPGIIVMWGGSVSSIPSGWRLCDGTGGAPDLRNRFIAGAGDTYDIGDVGGQDSFTIANSNLPQHSHTATFLGDALPPHHHTLLRANGAGSGPDDRANADNSDNGTYDTSSDSAGTPTGSVTVNNGGGVASPIAIDNRPSFYALAYIQKV